MMMVGAMRNSIFAPTIYRALSSRLRTKSPMASLSSNTGSHTSKSVEDPGTAFNLLLSCPSPLSSSQVFVDFGQSYDRIAHPDLALEESIKEIWEGRLEKNPSLYNGTKFRYGGFAISNVNNAENKVSVCLHLGLTDYRTFIGTNLNPQWNNFLIPSEDDTIRCKHMSNPLGNGAIVETSDNKILLLKRSQNVGEFPGYYVFPGGHSEPHEIGILSHEQYSSNLNEKISKEMFDGIIREVVEEIGVPADSLREVVFIGVSQREMNVRPTAFFYMNCNLDSSEIKQLYFKAQDGYESTQIYAVSMEELESMAQRMPGCHCGGLALYKSMNR